MATFVVFQPGRVVNQQGEYKTTLVDVLFGISLYFSGFKLSFVVGLVCWCVLWLQIQEIKNALFITVPLLLWHEQ